jgi:hypothetical protein
MKSEISNSFLDHLDDPNFNPFVTKSKVSNNDSSAIAAIKPDMEVDIKASPTKSEIGDELPPLEVVLETVVPPVASKDEMNKSG